MVETILIIIALSVLILAHEAGHFFSAKFFGIYVEEFGIGFPPRIFSKKIKETIYSINVLPFGGFVRIFGENEDETIERNEDKHEKHAFSDVSIWRRMVVLLSGVGMNVIVGWILFSFVFMIGVPFHLVVQSVSKNSPAAEAGIKAGDFIVSVTSPKGSIQDPIVAEDFKNFVSDAGEMPLTLVVRRGNGVREISLRGRNNPPAGEGSLGVGVVTTGIPRQGFFSAFAEGTKETINTLSFIVISFYELFLKIFSAPQEVAKSVAGPVGIVMIARQAGELGFVFFLQLLALISLELAVFNVIPFPALDGGRVLLLFYEAVFRSPASRRVQVILNAGGFLVLLGLLIFATYQDIIRFF